MVLDSIEVIKCATGYLGGSSGFFGGRPDPFPLVCLEAVLSFCVSKHWFN